MCQPIDIVKKYKEIPEIYRKVFASTFVVGVLTHLFVLTNKIITFDDLMCLNSFGGSFGSGRWLLGVLGLVKYKIFGNYSMPSLNGLMSIGLVAVFACLIIAVFEIENNLTGALIGAVLVVFPTIAGSLCYTFTSYYYCFALVLLGIGLLITTRAKGIRGIVIGALFYALSMGIYQAYFPFAIGVLLCHLILYTICEKSTWKGVFNKSLLYLVGLVVSLVIYFTINNFWLWFWKTEMISYKGMNQIGKIDIEKIPYNVKLSYGAFGDMLTKNYYGITGNVWIRIAIGVLLLTTFIVVIRASIRLIAVRQVLKAIELLAFTLMLPIGLHSIYLMVAEEYVYTLMIYADVLLIIFPLIACDKEIYWGIAKGYHKVGTTIMNWVATLVVVFACLFYICQDNAAYLELELSLSAAKSYYTTLITQIKSTEGYSPDKEVIIVGKNRDASVYEIRNDFFQDVEIGGVAETDCFIRGVLVDRFMKYYCGFDQVVENGTVEVGMDILTNMECYPKEGAIQVVGNQIVVKLSDDNIE